MPKKSEKKKKSAEVIVKKETKEVASFLNKIVRQPIVKKSLMIGGAFFIFLCFFVLIYNQSYSNKIYPHTYIGGINLGGKTLDEARFILGQKAQKVSLANIEIQALETKEQFSAQDLGIKYDVEKTAQTAWETSRKGSLGEVIKQQARSLFSKNIRQATFAYDDEKLYEILSGFSKKVDVLEKDAAIVVVDLKPVVEPEKIGRKINSEKSKDNFIKYFGNLKEDDRIAFQVDEISPKITKKDAQTAEDFTLQALLQTYQVKVDEKTFEIKPEELAAWLDFVGSNKKEDLNKWSKNGSQWVLTVSLKPDKTNEFIEKIASEVNQEPKDAKFEMQANKAVAFQLSQTGYEIDKEKSTKILTEKIFDLQKEIELAVKVTKPEITENSAANLGIVELVGEATTNFAGSPNNRRHNIATGAKKFHGVILKPGEEFSTLKYLGEVDASTGYLPELVIKEDRTVPEYGGGLCQVSTTLFRAALNTGLKITERTNHSYRVRYYEPPVGMDATIYLPKPDFKFVNDLSSSLLIQSSVSGDNITFRFFGTKDGRRSETTDPYVYDVTGSGDAIYSESADLAQGEIKQIETAHPGSKASFTYRVFDKNGKEINKQTFTSSYVPWPARYLYGPGTQIPQ